MHYTAEMFADLARTAHDPEAAEKAAALLNGSLDPDTVLGRLLHLDRARHWGRVRWSSDCCCRNERILEALNMVLDCHGVESLTPDGSIYPIGAYVNTGDTYTTTIILDEDGEFHVTSWGDFLEAWEREQAEGGGGF